MKPRVRVWNEQYGPLVWPKGEKPVPPPKLPLKPF